MKAPWLIICGMAGVLIGAAGTLLAVTSVVDLGDGYEDPDSTVVASGACDGATVTVTNGYAQTGQQPLVASHVAILDDSGRTWEVFWPGYGGPPEVVEVQDYSSFALTSALVGDSDDGLSRSVKLRPQGTTKWCRVG